jgi:TP901 family phage tail tape measure protein
MANLKVSLILDLVNRLSGPAKAAGRDIRGVGTAAKELGNVRAGERIARDLDRTRASAERAAGAVRNVRKAIADTAVASANLAPAARGGVAGDAISGALAASRVALGPAAAGVGVAGGIAGGGAAAAVAATAASTRVAISREAAMAEVKKKVDLPAGETFAGLERQISQFAIAYGRSFEDVAKVAAEAGATGVAFKDLAGFMTLATKASIAWDMSTSEAAQKLFEIRAATGKSLKELEEFGDKVNKLGDTSAAKESDILEMANRAMAAAKEAGVSEDASLAFLTAMRSVGIQPEIASRGFNALVSTLATANDSKKVGEGLKMLGLDAKAMAKAMKTDATAALLQLFTALEKSKDPIAAAVKIFGKEWFDEMLRTKGSIAEVKKQLETLSSASNYRGSMNNTLNIELATTSNHLKRLSALAGEVGNRLGSWSLGPINAAVERLVQLLDQADARTKKTADQKEAGEALAAGQPLTPEQRQQMAKDASFRIRAEAAEKEAMARRVKATEGTGTVIRGPAEEAARRQIDALQKQRDGLVARQRSPATPVFEQSSIASQLREIDTRLTRIRGALPDTDPKFAANKRADRDDWNKARPRQSETAALMARLREAELQIAGIREASRGAGPRDREGFDTDAREAVATINRTLLSILQSAAPGSVARQRFGFGPSGVPGPGEAQPGLQKPGRLGFGFDGRPANRTPLSKGRLPTAPAKDAPAVNIRELFEVDLGAAGMTMMERLRAGMVQGQSAVEGVAGATAEGVKGRLAEVDLSAAGLAMMGTLAAGITAGGPQAVAAAAAVAGQVRAASLGGTTQAGSVRNRMSASQHDGVG